MRVFAIVAVVGLGISLTTKPLYQATTEILIDQSGSNVQTVNSSDPLSQLFSVGQQQSVETQAQELQEPALIGEVAGRYGLAPKAFTVTIVKDGDNATNIIEVDAQAHQAQVAANAANDLVRTYLARQSQMSLSEILAAETFVSNQGEIARRKLASAEVALAQYKVAHNLADADSKRGVVVDETDTLRQASNSAGVELAVDRAQLAKDQALLTQQPPALTIPLEQNNAVINTLKSDIQSLQIKREGMTQPGGFTSNAPEVRAVDGQIAIMQAELAKQPQTVVTESSAPNLNRSSLQAQILTLSAQVSGLIQQIGVLHQQIASGQAQSNDLVQSEIILDRLTGDRDGAAAASRMFTDKLAELQLRQRAHHSSAQVISAAQPQGLQISQKRFATIALAGVIGLLLGLCSALILEAADNRVNTGEDAERVLGLPCIGNLPLLGGGDASALSGTDLLSSEREDYRALLTAIHFASIDSPVHTLLVASSTSGEGKTRTAVQLAIVATQEGKRVILVDTDMRKPDLHHLLGTPPVPGLTEVLTGAATLDDALLYHDTIPGLSTLTCGSIPPNAGALLHSRTFHALMQQLKEQADLIIFDSPPLAAVADGQVLASKVDGVLFIVEPGKTSIATAQSAMTLLRQARSNVLGVVLNKMPLRRPAYYGQPTLESSAQLYTNGGKPAAGAPVLDAQADHSVFEPSSKGQLILRSRPKQDAAQNGMQDAATIENEWPSGDISNRKGSSE